VDKVHDVVDLYLNPPEAAVVRCVDEKSQIQALDRTAPILPMLPGTPARASHDYVRAGTSSLYAALDIDTGNRGRIRLRLVHHRLLLPADPGLRAALSKTTNLVTAALAQPWRPGAEPMPRSPPAG
jgi:hypothetical protein